MRTEIMKFRSWDSFNKKMSYFTMNDLCNWQDDDPEKPSAIDDWMQWIGLLDKNGKEIYEGDIIQCEFLNEPTDKQIDDFLQKKIHIPSTYHLSIGVVEYSEDGFFVKSTSGDFYDPMGSNFGWGKVEVIGNIHSTDIPD